MKQPGTSTRGFSDRQIVAPIRLNIWALLSYLYHRQNKYLPPMSLLKWVWVKSTDMVLWWLGGCEGLLSCIHHHPLCLSSFFTSSFNYQSLFFSFSIHLLYFFIFSLSPSSFSIHLFLYFSSFSPTISLFLFILLPQPISFFFPFLFIYFFIFHLFLLPPSPSLPSSFPSFFH